MATVDRQTLLTYGAVISATIYGGCLGEETDGKENTPSNTNEETPLEREYDAENPFTIFLVNEGDRTRAVRIGVSRNGDEVFDDTLEVETGERITVAKYETTGRYTIRAETDEHQMETSADIERENLKSHRAASGQISADEDGVLIQVMYDD